MTPMRSVPGPAAELAWLAGRPTNEAMTGYDMAGWPASLWVLHAMYENPALPSDVTHHEARQKKIASGDLEPLIIGGVNLDDATTTVTGTPLGFVARPGLPWRRVLWSDYSQRLGLSLGTDCSVPPCHRWFPWSSWPVCVDPPPEGSLDEVSLMALLDVLAKHSGEGGKTRCLALYASLVSGDFDKPTVLEGPLDAVPELVSNAEFWSTPSNLWAEDRSWFLWTDPDLWATKVSGTESLIDAIVQHQELETVDWPSASRAPSRLDT